MVPMTATTIIAIVRRVRGLHPRRAEVQQNSGSKCSTLPEYLEASEIQAIISAAPDPRPAVDATPVAGWAPSV